MRRYSWVVGALLLAGTACEGDDAQQQPGPWQSDGEELSNTVNLELNEGVEVAPVEVSEQAMVMADALVFPAGEAGDVAKAWPVGAPVVGDRASSGAASNNAFGFMRKVVAVREEGGQVIVETEDASLEEVFVGDADISFDLTSAPPLEIDGMDVDALFTEVSAGPGDAAPPAADPDDGENSQGLAQISQALGANVSVGQAFHQTASWDFLDLNTVREVNGVDVGYRARGTMTGELDFDARMRIGFDVNVVRLGFPRLEYFEVEASGGLRTRTRLDLDVDVLPPADLSVNELEDLGPAIRETVFQNADTLGMFGVSGSVLIAESRPIRGPRIAGIPTTFRLKLFADCGANIYGNLQASGELLLSANNVSAGLRYTHDNGWRNIRDIDLGASASGTLSGGAGATIECGVTPRVDWLVADKGGAYLGVRASARLEGRAQDRCIDGKTRSSRPELDARVSLGARVDLQVGGEIDAWRAVDFGVGPFNIWSRDYGDIRVWEQTFPEAGLGWCVSPCDDGVMNEGESDVDCGGACLPCAIGKTCNAGSDCESEICSASGLCVATTCEDERLTEDETDVDCGGACPADCANGQACVADDDCVSAICSRLFDRCTSRLCENGKRDHPEPDIDCGALCIAPIGISQLCDVGQGCFQDADCGSGICNRNTTTCVDGPCTDGRLSGDESGPDCGGSCARKCTTGVTCRGDADCDTGLCNPITSRCAANACSDGRVSENESDLDCGGACGANCGVGQNCDSGDDCFSGFCHASRKVCVTDGCGDGALNGSETSIDCGGGTCRDCGLGKTCAVADDCLSGVCGGVGRQRCVVSQCSDGGLNGSESDIDCGGTCPVPCATGKNCNGASDCRSLICLDGVCISDRCRDRVQNGSETDVDCGGTCEAKCAIEAACLVGADCASGICNVATLSCVATECEDGVQNGDETDLDCGGSCQSGCGNGESCNADGDCESGICNLTTRVCVASECEDGELNGDETDLDCGGSCERGCGRDEACLVDEDCQSEVCTPGSNTCGADQCSNLTMDGDETGVDCGGSCPNGCAPGIACNVGADCASGLCNVNTSLCATDYCDDGTRNDGSDETDVDCGGPRCGSCPVNAACSVPNDCQSGFCSVGGQCVSGHCFDGRANNGESDVDCGGPCADAAIRFCGVGQGCDACGDCNSSRCGDAGTCEPYIAPLCSRNVGTDVWQMEVDTDGCEGPEPPFLTTCEYMNPFTYTLAYIASSESTTPASSSGMLRLNIQTYGLAAHPSAQQHLFHSLDITSSDWLELRWAGYVDGELVYMSGGNFPHTMDNPPTPWNGSGFSGWRDHQSLAVGNPITMDVEEYYWCTGHQDSFPAGTGLPDNCKGHSALCGGYDFSASPSVNMGLTAQGAAAHAGQSSAFCRDSAFSERVMLITDHDGNTTSRNYGTPGVAHAIWVTNRR